MLSLFKSINQLLAASCLVMLSLFAFSSAYAHGHQEHHVNQASDMSVINGYARATFPLAKTGAAYFTLHNQGDTAKTLIGVTVSEATASEAQIHTTVMDGDVMKMRELEDGVTIGAGEKVTFESGGHHIMLLGLRKGLVEGSEVTLTLRFENSDELNIVLPVKKEEAMGHHKHH